MTILDEIKSRAQEMNVQLPDLSDVEIEKMYATLRDAWESTPVDDKERILLSSRALSARSGFTIQAFLDFYWCIWRREVPPYAREWINQFMSGKWTILYCFRGSTKSTTLTITFTLFWLLHKPHSSALIVQANDPSATKSAALVSDIIKHYEGWKACTSTIVPDIEKGWGANGYFIKDTSMPYDQWLRLSQQDHLKDPSFVGMGIMSSEIVGMHPSLLLFDDIHDRKNSAYARDRQAVVDTVRANVIPTITRARTDTGAPPFVGVSCTFWDEQDSYHTLLETGLFQYIQTPIMKFDEKGVDEFEGKKVTLTWKEGFGIQEINTYRNINSAKEFARMYLCTLDKAGFTNYPSWLPYEAEKIDWTWPMVCGADPVNAYRATQGREGDRSFFAMAYGLRSPTGAAILGDGVLQKCTPFEAEQYIIKAQMSYVGYQTTVIETHGGGSVFISFLQRNPNLRILPSDQLPRVKGNKSMRQYELLEPLLRTGSLQIADSETPFLNTFRNYLDRYPNFDEHDPEWDVADAVFYMCLGMPDIASKVAGLADGGNRRVHKNPWVQI